MCLMQSLNKQSHVEAASNISCNKASSFFSITCTYSLAFSHFFLSLPTCFSHHVSSVTLTVGGTEGRIVLRDTIIDIKQPSTCGNKISFSLSTWEFTAGSFAGSPRSRRSRTFRESEDRSFRKHKSPPVRFSAIYRGLLEASLSPYMVPRDFSPPLYVISPFSFSGWHRATSSPSL